MWWRVGEWKGQHGGEKLGLNELADVWRHWQVASQRTHLRNGVRGGGHQGSQVTDILYAATASGPSATAKYLIIRPLPSQDPGPGCTKHPKLRFF